MLSLGGRNWGHTRLRSTTKGKHMRTSLRRLLLALAFAYPFACETTWASSAPSPSEQTAPRQAKPAIYFEQNAGQVGADIHFRIGASVPADLGARGVFSDVRSTDLPSEITTPTDRRRSLAPESPMTTQAELRMPSPGAFLGNYTAVERLKCFSNYFVGYDPARSLRSVPHYANVRYRQILPGVNREFHGRKGKLEYGDPSSGLPMCSLSKIDGNIPFDIRTQPSLLQRAMLRGLEEPQTNVMAPTGESCPSRPGCPASPSTLSPAAGLSLTISTKRSRFWIGEPIRVDVAWSASQRTEVILERGDFCAGSTRLIVDDGSGQAVYEEQPLEMCEGIGFAPLTLAPGAVRNTTVVFLGNGSYDGAGSVSPLFTRPGEYRLRLAYSDGGSRVLSNVLDLSVVQPQAEDLGALDAIRSSPRRFFYDEGPTSLARYPESRYLEWTRLSSSDLDAERWRYAADHEERDRALRRIVADLLRREWGQFEDGALRVAYLQAWTPALSDLRDAAATRIRQGYPDLARAVMGGSLSPDK